jgi:hypothetical protein
VIRNMQISWVGHLLPGVVVREDAAGVCALLMNREDREVDIEKERD